MSALEIFFNNWQQFIGMLTSIVAGAGWIMERGKRMRDNRASDVDFWTKTIETQNAYIKRQDARIESLEQKYESRIKGLEKENSEQKARIQAMRQEIDELSERLEKHEPVKRTAKAPKN